VATITKNVASETQKQYPASVGIACGSLLSDDELDMNLGLYIKKAGSYRVTVLLLEDGIVGYQNGGGNSYRHNDVARLALTSISGETVRTESDGQLVTKSYTARLDPSWNPQNLKVLIYVEKPFDSIGNSGSVNGADYYWDAETYIDNCRAVPIGEIGLLELK
jgi:hypothetical protein